MAAQLHINPTTTNYEVTLSIGALLFAKQNIPERSNNAQHPVQSSWGSELSSIRQDRFCHPDGNDHEDSDKPVPCQFHDQSRSICASVSSEPDKPHGRDDVPRACTTLPHHMRFKVITVHDILSLGDIAFDRQITVFCILDTETPGC